MPINTSIGSDSSPQVEHLRQRDIITSVNSLSEIPANANGVYRLPSGELLSYVNGVSVAGSSLLQVATRCRVSTNIYTGFWNSCGITFHVAKSSLNSIKIIHPNYIVSSGEVDTLHPATLECAIEYPVGTYTRVKYNGQDVGNAVAGGTFESDFVNVNIPNGAIFGVRYYLVMPNARAVIDGGLATGGLALSNQTQADAALIARGAREGARNTNTSSVLPNLVVTAGTGQTHGDGFTDPVNILRPILILGYSSNPSVYIQGDSIAFGQGDIMDSSLLLGVIERSIPVAYTNASRAGESVSGISSASVKRRLLAQYATHIITNYGHNDIVTGAKTGAQVVADLIIMAGLFPGKKFIVCTCKPYTTSIDGWATEVNQTVTASETRRLDFNALVRSGAVTGAAGVLDLDRALSTAFNSGKWIPGTTSDGIHPNNFGAYLASSQLNSLTNIL